MTVYEALRSKFSLPHYITLFEVRDATGFDSSRSADAIVVSLYRSRGYEVAGFEIKHNRADWLKELRDPSKAEEIGKFCDYFWLLTPHIPEQGKLGEKGEIIAKLDEIPGSWGWMVLKGERLKVLKPAQKLSALPPDRPMLCSLLYATKERCLADANRIIEETVARRIEERQHSQRTNADYYKGQYDELINTVRKFESATGLSVQYGNGFIKMGEAVRRLMKADAISDLRQQLEYSRNGALALCGRLEEAIREVEAVQKDGLPEAVQLKGVS